jgi:hypothetical protein
LACFLARVTGVAGAAVMALAGQAFAAGPGGGSSGGSGEPNTAPPPEDVLDPESGIVRPAAPDERTGHIYLGFGASATGPAGLMGPEVWTSNIAGVGYTLGGFLGVGIGRYGTLQALGDVTTFTSPGGCACTGRSWSLGLGVTYHIAQGLAFDPWGSFGMAYRSSIFQVQAPGSVLMPGNPGLVSQSYQGFDIARIAFGGDWYPASWFGFGPFIEVDAGTNLHRPAPLEPLPPGEVEGPRPYAFFQIGIRIAFDPMRRPAPRPAASQTASAPLQLAP